MATNIAEGYILDLVATILRDHASLIQPSTADGTGRLDHLTSLHNYAKSHGGEFPQITLDDVLSLVLSTNHAKQQSSDYLATGLRLRLRLQQRPLTDSTWRATTPGKFRWWSRLVDGMNKLSVPSYQAYSDPGRTCFWDKARSLASESVTYVPNKEQYKWYADRRQEKRLQTVGWGMGIERFFAWVFRHDDIRDLLIVPRLKDVICALAFSLSCRIRRESSNKTKP